MAVTEDIGVYIYSVKLRFVHSNKNVKIIITENFIIVATEVLPILG